ncbi:hypothetical protein [Streptomyces flaveus]|uniref:hypothetical protein n=1 Tax=Streptomyces flaveus TaxID=66370 RepID=UPI003333759E
MIVSEPSGAVSLVQVDGSRILEERRALVSRPGGFGRSLIRTTSDDELSITRTAETWGLHGLLRRVETTAHADCTTRLEQFYGVDGAYEQYYTDATGITLERYDAGGNRLATGAMPPGDGTVKFSDGSMQTVFQTSGGTITESYDPDGRLTHRTEVSVAAGMDGETTTVTSAKHYAPDGSVTSEESSTLIQHPGGSWEANLTTLTPDKDRTEVKFDGNSSATSYTATTTHPDNSTTQTSATVHKDGQ